MYYSSFHRVAFYEYRITYQPYRYVTTKKRLPALRAYNHLLLTSQLVHRQTP